VHTSVRVRGVGERALCVTAVGVTRGQVAWRWVPPRWRATLGRDAGSADIMACDALMRTVGAQWNGAAGRSRCRLLQIVTHTGVGRNLRHPLLPARLKVLVGAE
jgi:hypothetical protein